MLLNLQAASYTEENRFNFPTEVNGTASTAEAEHFELKNVGTGETWKSKGSRLGKQWILCKCHEQR